MKHAVIEDASVEMLNFFNQVSKVAKKEKQATISLNRMIYWWTRKPLIVGRALVLSSCFEKISDVEYFLGLESQKPYEYRPDLVAFKEKLGVDPKSIRVLDPFGGSGNLAFPTLQLGYDVTVSDYNPLAHMIEMGALKYPIEYGHKLHEDFSQYTNQILDETKNELNKYFSSAHLVYIWCWCIRCPYCSQRFPLVNLMYIEKTQKYKIGIKIIPNNKDFTIKIVDPISEEDGKQYTQKNGKCVCITCTNTIQYKDMITDISKHKDREMIVIQIQKKKGRSYILPTKNDISEYRDAVRYFNAKRSEFENEGLIPNINIHSNPRNPLVNYGITTWDQYFDERQMLVLCTFMQKIKKVCKNIPNKSHRKIISTYLAFVLAKRVNNAGFGVTWASSRANPVHVLSMRQPRICHNFAESNPFEKVSGSIPNILKNIVGSIEFTQRLQITATCKNESVTKPSDKQYDLIITDPPYGDDVQYGELSEFFYVWGYSVLKDYYDIPSRVPLDEDYCESQGRFGSKEEAENFFGAGLKKSFKAMNEKLKDDGLLVVLFSNSSTEVWNQFLEAMQKSRFRIVSSYAIHTEMQTNVLARNKASFMSSIVVTCRKITKESVQYFEDLIPKIDDRIHKILDDISEQQLLELPITDLLIMAYGKVLEVSTQHTELKSYQKGFTPDFETLIKNARSTIIQQLVVKLLKKQPDIIGSRMSFYVINKIFNNGQIPADDALKIAQAYNTSLDKLKNDQVIIQKGNIIYLQNLKRDIDYEPDKVDPDNLYQQICYLVSHQSNIEELLHHDNIKTDELKGIVEILIKNFDLKKNQGQSLSPDSAKEIQILNTIADHMGISTEHSYQHGTIKGRARKSMGDEHQSRLEKWK